MGRVSTEPAGRGENEEEMSKRELNARGFGHVLRLFRQYERLSQVDVAELVGVNTQTYRGWELGSNLPSLRRADALADLYDVSIDRLLELSRGLGDEGLG